MTLADTMWLTTAPWQAALGGAAAPPAFCATYIARDTELLANANPYISGMTQYQHCGIKAAFADV